MISSTIHQTRQVLQ